MTVTEQSLRGGARARERPLLVLRDRQGWSHLLRHHAGGARSEHPGPRSARRVSMATEPGMTIDGETRITGLIGDPVAHTRSPAILNAAYREAGLNWIYVAFAVPRGGGGDAVRGAPRAALRRAHRHHAAQGRRRGRLRRAHARRLRARRRQRGHDHRRRTAARVVDRRRGVRPLGARRGRSTPPAPMCSSPAPAARRGPSCSRWAVRVPASPSARAGSTRPSRRRRWCPADRQSTLGDVDPGVYALVVNATPLGMQGEPGPVPVERLNPGQLVVDTVYHPMETPFLAAARARGIHAVNGLGMLVHQAALAFESWTGLDAPVAAMRVAAARTTMGERTHDRRPRRRVLDPRAGGRVVPRPGDHACPAQGAGVRAARRRRAAGLDDAPGVGHRRSPARSSAPPRRASTTRGCCPRTWCSPARWSRSR